MFDVASVKTTSHECPLHPELVMGTSTAHSRHICLEWTFIFSIGTSTPLIVVSSVSGPRFLWVSVHDASGPDPSAHSAPRAAARGVRTGTGVALLVAEAHTVRRARRYLRIHCERALLGERVDFV